MYNAIAPLKDALEEIKKLHDEFYYDFGTGIQDIDFTRDHEMEFKMKERRQKLREF